MHMQCFRLCERTDLFEVQSPAESMTVELISSSLSSSKRGFVAEYHASGLLDFNLFLQ